MRWLALLVVLTAGCTFDSSGVGLELGEAGAGLPEASAADLGDGLVDIADGQGSDAAPIDVDVGDGDVGPDPDSSQPDSSPDMGGDQTLDQAPVPSCVEAACPLGCNTTVDRCNRVAPSNFDVEPSEWTQATADLILQGGPVVTVNTTTGRIARGANIIRPPGEGLKSGILAKIIDQGAGYPKLAVLVVRSLTVASDATVEVIGDNALAVYAKQHVSVDGTLTADAKGMEAGPGGCGGGAKDGDDGKPCGGANGEGGAEAGGGGSQLEAGGGGGGNQTAGAKGGNGAYGSTTAPGGQGGGVIGSVAGSPLIGGGGGGAGGGPDTAGNNSVGGAGGGGGGALQLVASGAMNINGTITASGAGGQGGVTGAGGGGGGAGGAILLEGATVSISSGAFVGANGGGGGAGSGSIGDATPNHGVAGLVSRSCASGGPGQPAWGGAGGQGGAGDCAAAAGDADANGGGGGGAVGRLRINAKGSIVPTSRTSPDPSTSTTVSTW